MRETQNNVLIVIQWNLKRLNRTSRRSQVASVRQKTNPQCRVMETARARIVSPLRHFFKKKKYKKRMAEDFPYGGNPVELRKRRRNMASANPCLARLTSSI